MQTLSDLYSSVYLTAAGITIDRDAHNRFDTLVVRRTKAISPFVRIKNRVVLLVRGVRSVSYQGNL